MDGACIVYDDAGYCLGHARTSKIKKTLRYCQPINHRRLTSKRWLLRPNSGMWRKVEALWVMERLHRWKASPHAGEKEKLLLWSSLHGRSLRFCSVHFANSDLSLRCPYQDLSGGRGIAQIPGAKTFKKLICHLIWPKPWKVLSRALHAHVYSRLSVLNLNIVMSRRHVDVLSFGSKWMSDRSSSSSLHCCKVSAQMTRA